MNGGRRTRKNTRKSMLWRWRSNPLRRRADIVEAWVVLAVWAVVAVGGTVAGLVTAHAADEAFDRQRAERYSLNGVLLTDVPRSLEGPGATSDKAAARVRWTDRDGSVHTDGTLVDTGRKAGSGVVVWTDGRGGIVTEPPSPVEAAVEAGVLAIAAALTLAGLAFGGGALARWRLDRRRVERWGRQWELIGPQWSHRTG
jgi:hypothetical protein